MPSERAPGAAERPTVSVALATRNGARFVGEQLRSILEQTVPVDEIVLSDDASSDGTVEIVERMCVEAERARLSVPRLKVVRNDSPLGVTANFASALGRCECDLIALCDQDDRWHPERIGRLQAQFTAPEVLLVFSNARQVDARGQDLGHDLFTALGMSVAERALVESGRSFTQFMRRNLVTGATTMLRRELVAMAEPFPSAWLHDEWLAVVAAAFGGVRICDEALTDYRQHEANQVGMRRLSFARKLRMFVEPRTDRNLRLYRRAAALAEWMPAMSDVPVEYQAAVREKLLFEEARQAFPRSRPLRVGPVLRQLRLGRYAKYGTGVKDAVRNILQPV